MSGEQLFTNARIVTPEAVIDGTLRAVDGRIVEIAPGPSTAPGALDCEGDFLIPGLVELHTDNHEKHFAPRPGVRWPSLAAVVNHDAQVAAAGITTVYDAVVVGDTVAGGDRRSFLHDMVETIAAAQARGVLRAEHRLHLRCEVSFAETFALFESFVEDRLLEVVSIMDHTPGQRQFTSLEKYRYYYQKKYQFTDRQFETYVEQQMAAHERHSASNRAAIVALARARGYTLASHDDATISHVAEAVADGMAIAEFPTTVEAAEASRAGGLQVLMGAPNLVRGGSHSGNVSTRDLAERGLVDILSSDYVPSSLIDAAFRLAEEEIGVSLPAAIATASGNPARAVGLADRGSLVPGLRADLVQVRLADRLPIVRRVWRDAARVI